MTHAIATRLKLPAITVAALVLLGLAFGFSLDRYPGFYVDDAFFAYPALHALTAGHFSYAVMRSAPYANDVWAYHGPVLANLDFVLFRLFGFSTVVSRLPDFLGGWLAALCLVLFLLKKGYRYAGLAFAVVWAGDRSVQELMYGRMEGIALLCLAIGYCSLELALTGGSTTAVLVAGFFFGFAPLVHPLCVFFAVAAFVLVVRMRRAALPHLLAGCAVNLPVLAILWHFKFKESVAQFRWHSALVKVYGGTLTLPSLFATLRWGRFWAAALVIFALVAGAVAIWALLRRDIFWLHSNIDWLLPAVLGLAGTAVLLQSAHYPYYLVYFSIWPILCGVIMAEEYWQQFRPVALVMLLVWLSSASWNVVRLRESVAWYHHLSRSFLFAKLHQVVPSNADVLATPELYSVAPEAGYHNFGVLPFYDQQQNACAKCYLLMEAGQFTRPAYVLRSNLMQRKVLYSGPAFPDAGAKQYPIVILSPEGR